MPLNYSPLLLVSIDSQSVKCYNTRKREEDGRRFRLWRANARHQG